MEDSLFVLTNMVLHNHLENHSHQFLPLDIHPTETTASAVNFPANMAATIGFPFTDAQWRELKRQAMIYKYMMASVPVPPHLLISSDSEFHTPSSLLGVNPRFGTNGRDQEPGRCRRTDGKKWRCSRDAAPDQKYCERHMHRGRPRSRKPVEQLHANNTIDTCHINKKTRHNPLLSADSLATLPVSGFNVNKNGSFSLSFDESDNKIGSADVNVDCVSAYKEPRSLEWMKMKGDPVSISTGEQRQSPHTEIGLATDSCFNSSHVLDQQRYHDKHMNLNLFGNLGAGEYQQGNKGIMFMNDSPAYTHHADGKMGGVRMSLGMIKSEENQEQANMDSDSWAVATTPGGPLAEVLQNGTSSAQSASAAANGDFADSPIITASSPDEIVQTSLVLFSESSGSCSLTTVAI